jgi:glycosyltransferase involved in cell wall biosynthesis
MRILLINHYAGSIRHGMEYRPYYLAREWKKLGHHPTIVASSVSHLRTSPPEIQGHVAHENVDGIPYIWLRGTKYTGNGLRRALNMFAFVSLLRLSGRRIARSVRPDVVIASSTYPLDNLAARYIARRAQARLIFEVHDLWPLSPIELGGMSPKHPFIVLMQWAENYAYRHAHKVVSMLPDAAPYMEQHGIEPDRFIHIPNGIDLEGWEASSQPVPERHTAEIAKLRLNGNFILGYAGAHGLANALPTLVKAGALLQDLNVAIVLVGQGPERDRLRELAKDLRADKVIFLPPVTKQSIPALLASMDALYIGWQKKAIYRFGISPNKLLDYMMAAKPIIHSVEAANDSVKAAGCGISTAPEDPAAIAEAVRQLMGMSEEQRLVMGRRGRAYARLNHDYTFLARKFIECLQ